MSGTGAGTGSGAPRVPFRLRTRLVGWAKVLLPLAALALLSTVFLLSRAPQGPAEIPFAEIEAIARDPRIDAPRLSGLAADGTAVTLEATRLLPLAGQPDGFRALRPRLETRSPSGLVARLASEEGEVLGPTRTLRLTGGVALDAESPAAGPLSVRTGTVTADLGSGVLTALDGVEATSRLGRLTAQAMRLEQGAAAPAAPNDPDDPSRGGAAAAPAAEGAARVVFNGAVRLVYEPPAPGPVPGTPDP